MKMPESFDRLKEEVTQLSGFSTQITADQLSPTFLIEVREALDLMQEMAEALELYNTRYLSDGKGSGGFLTFEQVNFLANPILKRFKEWK